MLNLGDHLKPNPDLAPTPGRTAIENVEPAICKRKLWLCALPPPPQTAALRVFWGLGLCNLNLQTRFRNVGSTGAEAKLLTSLIKFDPSVSP